MLDELPGPQRRALEVALLIAERTEEPDQRAVSLAALAAVRVLAREAPLLIAVDDVQWLDPSSAAVLGFAARRLRDEPVGLLVAQRTAGEAPVPLDLDRAPAGHRLDRLVLAPLSLGAVQRLLHRRLGWVPSRPELLHVHELSGGNPFFALELGGAVQATLHLRPGERLPLTLEALVGARLRGLSPATRRGLAVAAAMRQPTLAMVDAVAGAGALAAAEDVQIVHVRDGVVHFAHPLLASGAYTATDPATRRALHAAIAERTGEPEEHALHLALAATGPHEAVAGALDDAGRRALSRGAPAAAAELYERAVQLTPPGGSAAVARRRTDAATCAFLAGDSRRARGLLAEVLRTTERGPARARALVRLALVRGYDDDLRAAEGLLREAIEHAGGDAELTAEAHLQLAGMLFRLRERLREAVEHATAAAASELADVRAEAVGARLLPEAALSNPRATATLQRVLELDARGRHARDRAAAVPGGVHLAVVGRAGTRAHGIRDAVRRGGRAGRRELARLRAGDGAQIDCVRGDVAGARRHADEGLALTEQTGQATVGAYVLALRALADAIAGELDAGRERAGRALERRADERPPRRAFRAGALGLLEHSAGRPDAAVRALGPFVGSCARRDHRARHGARRSRPRRGADRARRAGGGRRSCSTGSRATRGGWAARPRWPRPRAAAGCSPAPAASGRRRRTLRDGVGLHAGSVPVGLRPDPASPTAPRCAARGARPTPAPRSEAAAARLRSSRRARVLDGPRPRGARRT